MATGALTKQQCVSDFAELVADSNEWLSTFSDVTDYIATNRGGTAFNSTPSRRKLVASKAINTTAEDALNVLIAGIQGGLAPSSRPWLQLEWANDLSNDHPVLSSWLFQCSRILSDVFADTNFYPATGQGIRECCLFGNGASFSDSTDKDSIFSISTIPCGDYVFTTDAFGRVNKFHRVYYLSPVNLVDRFGAGRVSPATNQLVTQKSSMRDIKFIAVLETTVKQNYMGMPYKRYSWEIGNSGVGAEARAGIMASTEVQTPLEMVGFHEFPVSIMRWEVNGNDNFGIGPGIKALPEVKRLQEIEKAYRLAVHKEADPPLHAPSYLKGSLKSLPGSRNFYRSPNDQIYNLYNVNFNAESVLQLRADLEHKIGLKFFNDIFITSARDPNASPLKAAEVVMRDGEKLFRLGTVMERIIPEYFSPMIIRCFNIAYRKKLFPPLPPELEKQAGGIRIRFTSPLAQAQKIISARSIETAIAFAGQVASVKPDALDNINTDMSIKEYFDAHGTPKSIINDPGTVDKIRKDRMQQQQDMMKQQQQREDASLAIQAVPAEATAQKARAEAGQILTDSFLSQQELSGL